MSEPGATPASHVGPAPGLASYTQLIYALHSLSVLVGVLTTASITGRFLFGLPSIIAVIMNYARRSEAEGTWLASHFQWQIRTFWLALLWCAITLVISGALLIVLIGVLLAPLGLGLIGLWVCYRVARGWLALRKGQALPAPAAAVGA
jgi:uncharacterized membrane protein